MSHIQTVTIQDPMALADLVRTCQSDCRPIIDYGIAHKGLGHSTPKEHVKLTQRGSVLEHLDRDMIVRAAAGTTMSDLQTVLKKSNQFLPIDADDDLTLGEVIMHNVYGPLRVGYGATRDLLLGLRYIDGLGRDIHVGGRTVKNVAGYDVTRLLVGSLGELGCVYEATIRTSTIPSSVLNVLIAVDEPALIDPIITDLLVGDAAPTTLSLHVRNTKTTCRVGYFGHTDACQAQLKILTSWLARLTGLDLSDTWQSTLNQDTQQRASERQWQRKATTLVKLIVPPATTGAICQAMVQESRSNPCLKIDALPADGCLFVGGDLNARTCIGLDKTIRTSIEPIGGKWAWYAKPTGTESIARFTPQGPDWPILIRLKQTMDPFGLFNPGRFLLSTKESGS